MRINTWVTVMGCLFVLGVGGCSGNDTSPPVVGGGGGGASVDAFTGAVAQSASVKNEDQEPDDPLAHMTPTTAEDTQPGNL